jgi:DNA primase
MSQSDVEKIKERLSIEEVVGSYIKVEKAGRNLKARCPFHHEKTPSFFLSPDRNTYYCFGCHAKGDIFSFVQEFEGVEFPEALEKLADRAGITLTKKSSKENKEYARLKSIMDLSTKFYAACLEKKPEALEYLTNRGLTKETIEQWYLGYAPDGWRNLKNFLEKRGYKESEIEKAGLIKKGDKGNSYDRFRERIIFPINDSSGKPVAFTGRVFGENDSDAKYLNSPDTPLFDKSRILHGFDKAKSAIRTLDFAILVEGQFDLIMAHQAGYKNAVASSGTALTQEHLHMISKISDKLVIAYDSDGAGFRASEKAWQMALSLGMDVKIAPIPSGQDPADLILESKEKWKQVIKDSKHIIEIITESIAQSNLDDRQKGREVSEKLIPYLANVASNIDQEHFVKKISDLLNISADAIRAEIANYEPEKVSTPTPKLASKISSTTHKDDLMMVEGRLFGIYFWQQSLPDSDKTLNPEHLLDEIKGVLGKMFDRTFEKIEQNKESLIFEVEKIYSSENQVKNIKPQVEELIKNLKLQILNKIREQYKSKLKVLEESGDSNEAEELMKKIQEISNKILNIS